MVSEFIRKCIGDVIPTVTTKTYPNQKLWIDGSIRSKLKMRTTAFNNGKATGNMAEYKQSNNSLCKAIKQAKLYYRDTRVAIQWLRHETYVAGSTDNHRLQKEKQADRRLASGQAKHILRTLWGYHSATDATRYQGLWALLLRGRSE